MWSCVSSVPVQFPAPPNRDSLVAPLWLYRSSDPDWDLANVCGIGRESITMNHLKNCGASGEFNLTSSLQRVKIEIPWPKLCVNFKTRSLSLLSTPLLSQLSHYVKLSGRQGVTMPATWLNSSDARPCWRTFEAKLEEIRSQALMRVQGDWADMDGWMRICWNMAFREL